MAKRIAWYEINQNTQKAFDRLARVVLKKRKKLLGTPWLRWTRLGYNSAPVEKMLDAIAQQEIASLDADHKHILLSHVFFQGMELGWELAQRGEVGKYGGGPVKQSATGDKIFLVGPQR